MAQSDIQQLLDDVAMKTSQLIAGLRDALRAVSDDPQTTLSIATHDIVRAALESCE